MQIDKCFRILIAKVHQISKKSVKMPCVRVPHCAGAAAADRNEGVEKENDEGKSGPWNPGESPHGSQTFLGIEGCDPGAGYRGRIK